MNTDRRWSLGLVRGQGEPIHTGRARGTHLSHNQWWTETLSIGFANTPHRDPGGGPLMHPNAPLLQRRGSGGKGHCLGLRKILRLPSHWEQDPVVFASPAKAQRGGAGSWAGGGQTG